MRTLEWKLTRFPCRVWARLKEKWSNIKLLYYTLTFNTFSSWGSLFETAMEPLFWFVDHFVKYLGPIFVMLVVCLTTSVVVIFYLCILPDVFQQSVPWTIFHLVFGHWLLLNIVFHYTMAAFTDPGKPASEIPQTISLCKKCVSPKPPRTHHCSICGECVLKMDHHCPWLNNCVGFFNHRYFFLFCVYMWLGTVYVSVTGYDLFREHFYGSRDVYFPGALYPLNIAHVAIMGDKGGPEMNKSGDEVAPTEMENLALSEWSVGHFIHTSIVYEFMLCSGVVIALGLLTLWHVRLIGAGQTSIEAHINQKERKRYKEKGLVYKNPYDFGWKRNWEIFLGLEDGRTFFHHILFPSTHTPYGEGLIWRRATHPSVKPGSMVVPL